MIEEKSKSKFLVKMPIFIGASIFGIGLILLGIIAFGQSSKEVVDDISKSVTPIAIADNARVLGKNDAKVTIVEFADYQCPYCSEWQKTIFPELKSKYIDTSKVRFVYMGVNLLGEESLQAEEAVRCAVDQSKFWEYHNYLYAKQNGVNEGAFSDLNLKLFAKDLQLNTLDFNSCIDDNRKIEEVKNDITKTDEYNIQSTPTIFINNTRLEGILPLSMYEEAIEAELNK